MEANRSPTIPVSAIKVEYSSWQSSIKEAGSLRAINGVNVTTELAGMVQVVYFTPGAMVEKGSILVQLNADAEIGQLESLQAQAINARIIYERDQKQFAIHAVSKQTVDTDLQNLKSLLGQVAQQKAIVEKKTIRAPFSGRLGINYINLGQYINPGDTVTSLQALDPIYADFYVPQQELYKIKLGQTVFLTSDAFPGKRFSGKITTINPAIETDTRNIQIEATIPNKKYELTPGAFVNVEAIVGAPIKYLTLPQTAISYNPYGNLVYVVKQTGKDKDGKPILVAKQRFVDTGETRGDQIQILDKLKEGEMVVTSGQLKLKNGSHVVIDNAVVPTNNPVILTSNEHANSG
jgi:membrane fusion protein (multidrug efflux system)